MRNINRHTFFVEVGADIAWLHGPAILLIEAESLQRPVDDDKGTKQISDDHCFMRDQSEMESAKILVSKDRATRMVHMWCH